MMTRRSTLQAKIDDSAFPVRVLICVPEMGFGRRSDALHEWLATWIGRETMLGMAVEAVGRATGLHFICVNRMRPAPA